MKDPIALLNAKNVNKTALLDYIKDACDYCTDYQLPNLEFELNHHNEPDVALFDFTSMFAASNSCYVKERHGKQVLLGKKIQFNENFFFNCCCFCEKMMIM